MQSERKPVVVAVDGTDASVAAIEWATYEATNRRVPLRVVSAFTWPPELAIPLGYTIAADRDDSILRTEAQRVVDEAVAMAHGFSAEVEVVGEAISGRTDDILLAESLKAERVVLGSRHRDAMKAFVLGSVGGALAGHAACPVLICRATVPLTHGDAIVVGVDPSEESQAVLGVAFAEASTRDAKLIAVMCWHPHLYEKARWLDVASRDARAKVERWLAEALSGWQEKYPEVVVEARVVEDHPVTGLVAESDREQLLIVGSRGHMARAGSVLGSVSQGVLHHAATSVLVVPTSGQIS